MDQKLPFLNELANPFQSPNNFFTVSKKETNCYCPDQKECRVTLKVAKDSLGYICFTVTCNGKQTQHMVDISKATTKEELYEIIYAAATTMIPEGGFGGKFNDNAGQAIEVTEEGLEYAICINTDINITGHKEVGETEVSTMPTLDCEVVLMCKFQFAVEADGTATHEMNDSEGNSVVLGPYTAGTTTEQDVVTEVEAALGTLGTDYGNVSAKEGEGAFIVTVETSAKGEEIVIDGAQAQNCGCEKKWATPKENIFLPLRSAYKKAKTYGGKGGFKNLKASTIVNKANS